MTYKNFELVDKEKGVNLFRKKLSIGNEVIYCSDLQIKNGEYKFMIDNRLTLTDQAKREIKKNHSK